MNYRIPKHATATRVASFKAHTDTSIKVYNYDDVSKDEARDFKELVEEYYRETIKYNQEKVNEELVSMYGRELRFAENMTSDVLQKFKNIRKVTGKSIKQVTEDFKQYLGQDCSFFRKEGAKQIPIESDRILKAYIAMKEMRPRKSVERILYHTWQR